MPETPSIEYPYQVMFFDTDCAGVVHNLAYLRMIETARTLLAEQLGLDMVSMGNEAFTPPCSAPKSTTAARRSSPTNSSSAADSMRSSVCASG
jgi:hypothetical protein